jgi:hypothetical protein
MSAETGALALLAAGRCAEAVALADEVPMRAALGTLVHADARLRAPSVSTRLSSINCARPSAPHTPRCRSWAGGRRRC